jgi:hypothetical protein
MDLDALMERRLPESLVKGFRQVQAGVNDSGPP